MKKICYILFGLLMSMTLIISCATIEKPEVKKVNTKPAVMSGYGPDAIASAME